MLFLTSKLLNYATSNAPK
eukprot:UN16575